MTRTTASGPDVKQGVARQSEQVEPGGEDVLAQVTRGDLETCLARQREELGLQEVDLAKVRLGGIDRYTGAMLDRGTGVRITFDPVTSDERDPLLRDLAEPVHIVPGNTHHGRVLGRHGNRF